MARRAIVQGEIHIDPRDAQSLLSESDEAEVFFREGRSDDIRLIESSVKYSLFLVGYLLLESFYATARWLLSRFGNGYDSSEDAEERGLAVETEIDYEFHEMFEIAAENGLWVGFIFSLAMTFHAFTIASIGGSTFGIPHGIYGLIELGGVPFIFFFIGVVLAHRNASRDEKMANSIDSISEREGYESALVLVGDSHVEAVAEELESNGWVVDSRKSSNPLGKLSRAFAGFVGG